MTLIFCPNVYFNWARTFRFAKLRSLPLANMRGTRMREGQPKKERRRSFVAYLPSLLGFPSRALLFLTLSSLLGSAYAFGSRSLGGQGIRKAGAHVCLWQTAQFRLRNVRGRRKPKGIGGMRACEFSPVPLGCHPRFVGRNDTWDRME